MAGDWLQIDTPLTDEPFVYQLSDRCGKSVPEVIGHLCLLWAWADAQTYCGKSAACVSGLAAVCRSDESFVVACNELGVVRLTNSGSVVVGRGRRQKQVKIRPLGWVYFILAPSSGLVKIGFTSKTPEHRLDGHQTGSPEKLELLGAIRGSMKDERRLHAKFAHIRDRREWFRMCGELREFISRECGGRRQ